MDGFRRVREGLEDMVGCVKRTDFPAAEMGNRDGALHAPYTYSKYAFLASKTARDDNSRKKIQRKATDEEACLWHSRPRLCLLRCGTGALAGQIRNHSRGRLCHNL